MNIDENTFRMPIYPMLKLWILMSWMFRFGSSHALCTQPWCHWSYWPRLYSGWKIDQPWVTLFFQLTSWTDLCSWSVPHYVLIQSPDGASPDISDMSQHAQTTFLIFCYDLVKTYALRFQSPREVRLSIFTEYLPIWINYWGFSLEIHIFLANVGRCDQWVVMPPGPPSIRLTVI